ncbi:uncharacterized protein LOC134693895 [Mytilus trossulus]|uniref:uncharacterized protein LOC134693895 n=1 Tax=Mytilus trossulus TaxID=6551 RepID=UPI00300596DF
MEAYLIVMCITELVAQAYSCCMPEKMEGKMRVSVSERHMFPSTRIYDKFVMDTTIGKGYLSGTVYFMGFEYHTEIFQDYVKGQEYHLSDGSCFIIPKVFNYFGRNLCMPPSSKIMSLADQDIYRISLRSGQMT